MPAFFSLQRDSRPLLTKVALRCLGALFVPFVRTVVAPSRWSSFDKNKKSRPTGKSYPIPSYIEPFMIGQDNMLLMISPKYRIQYGPDNNMDDYMNDEGVIIPMDKQALLGFKIYVLNKYKFVRKNINFKLTLPVKSAQYLTWIKDRFSNDDAEMSYKDEVLTCSFQSNTGLEVIPE